MDKNIINKYCEIIENRYNEVLPFENTNYSSVTEAMRYSFLLGGKRIRPIILLEFYRICGGNNNGAVNFALALEMIHTYSLIHDDLPCMDDDDMRRGMPSNHIKYGEDIALLAGDGLLTHAFYTASLTKDIPADLCIKAINELSLLSGYKGMIGGQVIDLESENKDVSIEVIDELNLLKTGGLLRAAAKIGAILSGANDKIIELADDYGRYIGLAFQITDDILDCCGDESVLGKPVNSDEKNNKSTYVSVYGIDKCKKIVRDLTDKALDCLEKISCDSDIVFLKDLTVFLATRNH
ncbi:MAG: farnesyl diphosphate synthase [Acutalibacteraceae bacterium]|nr:farnesyl diphosphate synthase [Acutalibacteraceae bacterium]